MFAISLRQKLGALAVLAAAAAFVTGAVGLSGLRSVSAIAAQVAAAQDVQRQQMSADMVHDAVRGHVVGSLVAAASGDTATVAGLADDFTADAPKLVATLDSVAARMAGTEVGAAARAARPGVVAYLDSARAVLGAVRGDGAAAAQRHFPGFQQQFRVVEGSLGDLGDRVAARTAAIAAAGHTGEARTRAAVAGVVLVACLLAGLIALLVGRAVRRPIVAMADAARRLADGDVSPDVLAAVTHEGADEIGTLAGAFRALGAYLQEAAGAADAVGRGDLDATVRPRSDHDRLLHALDRAIAALRGAVGESQRLIDGARAGDLAVRGDATRFTGGYADLVAGLNTTVAAVQAPLDDAVATLARVADRDLTARMAGSYAGAYGGSATRSTAPSTG